MVHAAGSPLMEGRPIVANLSGFRPTWGSGRFLASGHSFVSDPTLMEGPTLACRAGPLQPFIVVRIQLSYFQTGS